jgi:6-phosphogluconolactonase
MNSYPTEFGMVKVADADTLFSEFSEAILAAAKERNYPPGVALTGGSSPKKYFHWLLSQKERFATFASDVVFTVSDERYVPVESDESNYGNAQRLFFDPFGVAMDNRFPWDTTRTPADAADWFGKLWSLSFGDDRAFDICMLGMGDDCHTASLFPGSPLLEAGNASDQLFASVAVPGKGERLTITPYGLSKCDQIFVLVTGEGKKEAVKRVFVGTPSSVSDVPVTLLKSLSDKVVWLIDSDAAGDTFAKKEADPPGISFSRN